MKDEMIMALGPLVLINVTYVLARLKRDFSIIDTSWGIGFVLLAIIGCALSEFSLPLENLLLCLVLLWGFRLAAYIFSRNSHHGEDARYAAWRKEWGERANLIFYFKVYLLQFALMLVVGLPLFAVHRSPVQEFSWTTYLGILIWAFGLIWETVGDYQKSSYKKLHPKGVCQVGLWNLSRHPNYFGEATLWWGVGLISLQSGQYWGLLGPLFLNFLLVKVSGVPLVEKPQEKNPEFQAYKMTTPSMIPKLSKLWNS